MAMVTITSDSGTNMSPNLSFEYRNSLRDASFSSYLDRGEQNFVRQIAKSSQNNLNSFSSIPHDNLHLGWKYTEYGEIDVFSADKYFNEEVDEAIPKVVRNPPPKFQDNKDDPLEIQSFKQKIRPGTPSIRSESSWNSQSALLRQMQRNQETRNSRSRRSKSLLASLGCNCSCNDKDSVSIGDQISEDKAKVLFENGKLNHFKKSHSSTQLRDEARRATKAEDDNSFPDLNFTPGNANMFNLQHQEGEDTRRKSLEVFGSPVLSRVDKSLSPDKTINLLAWDAIPRPREVKTEFPKSPNGKYNDADSDASSDLFEIESFSTNANLYIARDTSDGMSGCVTPTCYAPSEASIEWSTVTASAADFCMMSDSEEIYATTTTKTSFQKKVIYGKNGKNEMPKWRPGILSGCKSHKSVRVAGEAYRVSGKASPDSQTSQKSEPLTPITTRFHHESKLAGFDSRIGEHRFKALSLSEAQFNRAPHLLYMP